jgi:hypothetical protein
MKRVILSILIISGLVACQTTGGIVPKGSGLNLCNDFGSVYNCIGGNYISGMTHRGLDFGAPTGTKVVSSTYGMVTRSFSSECSGYEVHVSTDLQEINPKTGKLEFLNAAYAHAKAVDGIRVGTNVKPGDVISEIIPILGTKCYGSTEHVHFQLYFNSLSNFVDPHKYWENGPKLVTCYRKGMKVQKDKIVAPLLCD